MVAQVVTSIGEFAHLTPDNLTQFREDELRRVAIVFGRADPDEARKSDLADLKKLCVRQAERLKLQGF
jgi:hypothetical protein